MLRTNSKQARLNLRSYIMDAWNIEEGDQGRDWNETRDSIKNSFYIEAYSSEWEQCQRVQNAFINWLGGLPRGLGDFYLCQGVEDLGNILEETEAERAQYAEIEAQDKLAYLIYKEVFSDEIVGLKGTL